MDSDRTLKGPGHVMINIFVTVLKDQILTFCTGAVGFKFFRLPFSFLERNINIKI